MPIWRPEDRYTAIPIAPRNARGRSPGQLRRQLGGSRNLAEPRYDSEPRPGIPIPYEGASRSPGKTVGASPTITLEETVMSDPNAIIPSQTVVPHRPEQGGKPCNTCSPSGQSHPSTREDEDPGEPGIRRQKTKEKKGIQPGNQRLRRRHASSSTRSGRDAKPHPQLRGQSMARCRLGHRLGDFSRQATPSVDYRKTNRRRRMGNGRRGTTTPRTAPIQEALLMMKRRPRPRRHPVQPDRPAHPAREPQTCRSLPEHTHAYKHGTELRWPSLWHRN